MNLDQTYFELFGQPARFAVDTGALEARYRELQREVHPDRFATAPQAEQRVSLQLATRVNEAYQTLKSPLKRAEYLLLLNGVDAQFETNTSMPPEFLVGQLELREALEEAADARDAGRLERLSAQLRGERDALLAKLGAQLDSQKAWAPAAGTLRQLMFLERFRAEIEDAEERMEG
jgi:molecular chaperone HscB